MTRTYTQLTQEQRYQIYALLKARHNHTEIATSSKFISLRSAESLDVIMDRKDIDRIKPTKWRSADGMFLDRVLIQQPGLRDKI